MGVTYGRYQSPETGSKLKIVPLNKGGHEDSTKTMTTLSCAEDPGLSAEVTCFRCVMASVSGRKAFISYLINSHVNTDLKFFDSLVPFMKKSNNSEEYNSSILNSVKDTFCLPEVINMTDSDYRDCSYATNPETFAQGMVMTIFDSATLLIWRECVRFMHSAEYASIPAEDKCTNSINVKMGIPLTLQQNTSDSPMVRVMKALRPSNQHFYTSIENFMQRFYQTLESLPFAVSVASASTERPGFPIIYANKQFELSTGYNRHNIAGVNCRFMQCPQTERDSVARMSEALRDAKPVRVVVTNRRRTGDMFLNYLAMKPVFDTKARYRFVVAISYPALKRDVNVQELNVMTEFLSLIPDTIPHSVVI
mmetsp:Transcript_24922/g.36766  ORF Transcript_24922/g.36766 Transcript_24922/m.36766 type:complete len:365 (-) Transcript_24922:403-1497(-)